MRLTDRVLDNNKKWNREKKKELDVQQDVEEDDMGYAYDERPKWGYLNTDKGIFADDDNTSINTAPSVFERTAIFRVRKEE